MKYCTSDFRELESNLKKMRFLCFCFSGNVREGVWWEEGREASQGEEEGEFSVNRSPAPDSEVLVSLNLFNLRIPSVKSRAMIILYSDSLIQDLIEVNFSFLLPCKITYSPYLHKFQPGKKQDLLYIDMEPTTKL